MTVVHVWPFKPFMSTLGDIDPSVVLEPDGFFRAIDRNTYDVDCDHTGFYSKSPQGYGPTPLDAIVDLLDQMEANNRRREYERNMPSISSMIKEDM